MHLVISCSNKPNSFSRVLAGEAFDELCRLNEPADLIDLQDYTAQFHDEDDSNNDIGALAGRISSASSVLLAAPIYHFDAGSTAKYLIEKTTDAWRHKVVGLLCAGSGRRSYTSIMGLANGLMLEFHCLIVPYIVFATPKSFEGQMLKDKHVAQRIEELVSATCGWSAAAVAIRESRQIRRAH